MGVLDEFLPPAAPQPTHPVAPTEPQPVPSGGSVLDQFSTPPAATGTSADRPYLDRVGDIPGDVVDVAAEGLQPITDAASGEYMNQSLEKAKSLMAKGYSKEAAVAMASLSAMHDVGTQAPVRNIATGLAGMLFSPLTGTIRSMGSRPLEEKTGIPKEITEFVAGLAMGRPRITKNKPSRVTSERAHDKSTEDYTVAKGLPIEFKDSSITNIASDIATRLQSPAHGYRDTKYGAPATFDRLTELGTYTKPVTMADIDVIKVGLQNIADSGPRTVEGGAARRALEMLDKGMKNLKDTDTVSGGHLLPDFHAALDSARGNWAAHKQLQFIEEQMAKAVANTASTGKGGNLENNIRKAFKPIYTNPAIRQRYSHDEIAMAKEITEGNLLRDTQRHFGSLAPTGIVSTFMSSMLGHGIGGWKGALASMGIGKIAKSAAERQAKVGAERLSDMVGARSPLGREEAAAAAAAPRTFKINTAPGLATVAPVARRLKEEGWLQ